MTEKQIGPCQDHWTQIVDEVKKRGLGRYIPKDGQEALDKQQSQERLGKVTAENFDPLTNALLDIIARHVQAYERINVSVPEGCPLCHVANSRPGLDRNWIDGSVNDQVNIESGFKAPEKLLH